MPKGTVTPNNENPPHKKVSTNHQKMTPKSYEWGYDSTSGLMVLKILDPEGMYPFILIDPERGPYRVIRTSKGGLQMTK